MAGLSPADQEADALARRHSLAQRWGLGDAAPSLPLLDADRDGLREHLRLGWLLTCPDARALIPAHDAAAIAALDPAGRPFAPDRLRVALAPRVAALQALGVPQLLERFAAGKVIAATDPAVLSLHATATAHRAQLAAAAGVSPGAKASGTLRSLLRAIGWKLERAGRIHTREEEGEAFACTYSAAPIPLPEGVSWEALTAVFLRELQPLSPEAQAVWDAFHEDEEGVFVDFGDKLAAALRAATDQAIPLAPSPWSTRLVPAPFLTADKIRERFLAIAAELNGCQP
jgi:hypothetical protein